MAIFDADELAKLDPKAAALSAKVDAARDRSRKAERQLKDHLARQWGTLGLACVAGAVKVGLEPPKGASERAACVWADSVVRDAAVGRVVAEVLGASMPADLEDARAYVAERLRQGGAGTPPVPEAVPLVSQGVSSPF